jgi:hypothetical protein
MPPPPEAPKQLRRQQLAFAAHLRDPAGAPAPAGIEERRLAVYRDLFYRNIESLLAGNFPVLRRLLADADWHRLVRAFYREHRATTPLFPEIGREFMRYVEARQQRGDADPAIDLPFLMELVHYEWVELALALDESDIESIAHVRDGDLLDAVPVPSPLAWPLAYRWPVHRLSPEFQPTAPPPAPTFLLVVRDRADAVRFKEIGAAAYQLVQRVHANRERTGRELLEAMAAEAGQDPARFVDEGAGLLDQLRERDAILGTRASVPATARSPRRDDDDPVKARR